MLKAMPINVLKLLRGQCLITRAASSATAAPPQRTALYDFHVKRDGKIVNFGGYALPVQYADQGITASHLHTRKNASIFDVSHMLQTYVSGKDAAACIESICTADISAASNGASSLTVFTNTSGGILDDLIVTKINDKLLYVVSNAAMKQQDTNIMSTAVSNFKSAGKDVAIEFLSCEEQSLIAVQGPKAITILSKLLPPSVDLNQLYFMNTMQSEIAGVPSCRITRCGYTGEDGAELSIPSSQVQHVTEALLETGGVEQIKMAGLGARDSLRLEAGLCLYGSDIDAATTPAEANLSWLIAKRRRTTLDFPGAELVCAQLKPGNTLVKKRRIGLKMLPLANNMSPPPARAGVEIFHNDIAVGHITSGCPSPSLTENIAMGYIKSDLLKKPNDVGLAVKFKIRNKFYDAVVAAMPFVKSNYYVKPKKN